MFRNDGGGAVGQLRGANTIRGNETPKGRLGKFDAARVSKGRENDGGREQKGLQSGVY